MNCRRWVKDIADPRRAQGRRHPLPVVLAIAAGAKEVWFVFPESHLVEFYGSEGKRAVTQFIVDLTEFWHSY